MLKKLEFNESQLIKIINYCKRKNISFMSSPFDLESLETLFKLKIKDIKIASGELTHYPLLKKIASSAKRIFLSTGMSNSKEIKSAIKVLLKTVLIKIKFFYCTVIRIIQLNLKM